MDREIYAMVDLRDDANLSGKIESVGALRKPMRNDVVEFYLVGDAVREAEQTMVLCAQLVRAGFRSFVIGNSLPHPPAEQGARFMN